MSIEKGAWAGLVGDFEREERRKSLSGSCKLQNLQRKRERNERLRSRDHPWKEACSGGMQMILRNCAWLDELHRDSSFGITEKLQ